MSLILGFCRYPEQTSSEASKRQKRVDETKGGGRVAEMLSTGTGLVV